MSIVSVHQPNYIPWLGFWNKMAKSDVMILLDVVQFEKNEFQNRQKIKLSSGQPSWLTIPIHHKHPQAISTIEIDSHNNGWWSKRHLHALRYNYERAGWWKAYGAELEAIYTVYSKGRMAALNVALIEWAVHRMGIKTGLILASDLLGREDDMNADPTQRLVDLCKIVKADTYLTGPGALDYLEAGKFTNEGIAVRVQRFEHPVYNQLYGEFVPNLSVMDLLFNVGAEEARKTIVTPVEVIVAEVVK